MNMGRQIQIHILHQDFMLLMDHLNKSSDISLIEMLGHSADPEPVMPSEQSGQTLCIWNHGLIRDLHREYISHAKREPYRVDETTLPILELKLSRLTEWEGESALLQGRIYGIFQGKVIEFERWFNSIVRFIRKAFIRNPTSLGGYVGPAAYKWYKSGGILLPFFYPPHTSTWENFVNSQHEKSK